MAENAGKQKGTGCMGRVGLLFLICLFCGMISASYFMAQPQDLQGIGGYEARDQEAARDLALVLEKSLEKGHSVALTEAEINRWLARTLSTRQGGMASRWVTLDGVWVRLLDGCAEIVQERRVMGRKFTVSMFVSIERTEEAGRIRKQVHLHAGPYHESLPHPTRGGRFGRLVVPQGFLVFVMPSYRRLAEEFRTEIRLGLEEMSSVHMEDGRLVLNPREPRTP